MRKIIPALLLLAMAFTANAQKPALPSDYFNSKIYTISPGLRINDSTAVRTEIYRLADSVYQYCKIAGTQYQISDSTARLDPAFGIAITAPFLSHWQEARDSLLVTTRAAVNPKSVNALNLLMELCIAYHLSKDTATLSTTINEKINTLSKDYQRDNANTLKGVFHPDYAAAALNRRVITTLQQAQEAGGNQIQFYNMAGLIRVWLLNEFLMQQYPVLQRALYAIDNSKIEKTTVAIPMRDGVKLSALVFRNVNATEKQPAIISQSPYPVGTEATRGNIFGANGYVYLYVDCRGRRTSEGEFFPYENDARDFYDIIDWVSKQPWCNGKCGTSGGSYLGFTQWQAIRKEYKHPALKAINPMVSVGFGVDFPRESNIFYSYILQWASYVSGRDLNEALFRDFNFWSSKAMEMYRNNIPFAKFDSVAGIKNEFFRRWVSHPDFDNYWKGVLPKKDDYAKLDIPVLTVTGYYDDDQNGAMYYYKNHQLYGGANAQANHHMLIGPYNHGGSQWNPEPDQGGIKIEPEAQIPIYKYVISWFDWRLKGAAKPTWIKDKITYFATGTGQWKGTPSFKTATTDTLKFYLSSNKVASETRRTMYQLQPALVSTKQNLLYKHNITEAIDSAFLYATQKPNSDSLSVASKYNMIFETPPLANDILITDRITADLYASLNVPDADFEVSFMEVTPDGKYKPFSFTLLRCRYRNGGDKPQLMTKGKTEKLEFNNTFVYIKKIAKGSKLRMIFESNNNPAYEKNYGFGGVVAEETTKEPRNIEATILMDKQHPSCIKVPIGKL